MVKVVVKVVAAEVVKVVVGEEGKQVTNLLLSV